MHLHRYIVCKSVLSNFLRKQKNTWVTLDTSLFVFFINFWHLADTLKKESIAKKDISAMVVDFLTTCSGRGQFFTCDRYWERKWREKRPFFKRIAKAASDQVYISLLSWNWVYVKGLIFPIKSKIYVTLNHIILDHFVVKSENNGMYADLVDKNLANRGWKPVFMCYFGRLIPLRVYVRTCSPTSGSHISCGTGGVALKRGRMSV